MEGGPAPSAPCACQPASTAAVRAGLIVNRSPGTSFTGRRCPGWKRVRWSSACSSCGARLCSASPRRFREMRADRQAEEFPELYKLISRSSTVEYVMETRRQCGRENAPSPARERKCRRRKARTRDLPLDRSAHRHAMRQHRCPPTQRPRQRVGALTSGEIFPLGSRLPRKPCYDRRSAARDRVEGRPMNTAARPSA